MKAEKLSDIKKELAALSHEQLLETCLKLVRFKKDNKELLSYVLFHAQDPLAYAGWLKEHLLEEFQTLKKYDYHSAKALRKILRQIAKHAKYTGSVQVELELLLWFCRNFLLYADLRSTYKPLQTIFIRQIEKIRKLFPKLHEDLQFDYTPEYEELLREAEARARWFRKNGFLL